MAMDVGDIVKMLCYFSIALCALMVMGVVFLIKDCCETNESVENEDNTVQTQTKENITQ